MSLPRINNTLLNDLFKIQLGFGTWQWGDKFVWGYGREDYTDDDIKAAFDTAIQAGIQFFDTAEIYGLGKSERFIGAFIPQTDQPVFVATKYMPFPWRTLFLPKRAFFDALRNSLKRLGISTIPLYQIHWPNPLAKSATLLAYMAEAVDRGLIQQVGVSNFNTAQVLDAHKTLSHLNIPLASNQIKYNLLDRQAEFNGLMEVCKDLGVRVIAYSPLAQGFLSGKYTPERMPSTYRYRRLSTWQRSRFPDMVRELRLVGDKYEGKSPAQVAINWTIMKGTLPIPGVKNSSQVLSCLGALGWRLTPEDLLRLDEISALSARDQ